jgi:hypothetical protein
MASIAIGSFRIFLHLFRNPLQKSKKLIQRAWPGETLNFDLVTPVNRNGFAGINWLGAKLAQLFNHMISARFVGEHIVVWIAWVAVWMVIQTQFNAPGTDPAGPVLN